jgi:hypothetical protein
MWRMNDSFHYPINIKFEYKDRISKTKFILTKFSTKISNKEMAKYQIDEKKCNTGDKL